jgi:hypothetical protein
MNRYAIKDLQQLAQIVSEIGHRLSTKANRIARSERKIGSHLQAVAVEQARANRLGRHDDDVIMRDAARILAFLEAHPELRTKQTFDLGAGTASIRTLKVGALQFQSDEAATIAEIRERFPEKFDSVVKTTYAIRKNDLKEDAELLEQLTTAYAEPSEAFTIQPANTPRYFRRSLGQIKSAAIKLGLLPEA